MRGTRNAYQRGKILSKYFSHYHLLGGANLKKEKVK